MMVHILVYGSNSYSLSKYTNYQLENTQKVVKWIITRKEPYTERPKNKTPENNFYQSCILLDYLRLDITDQRILKKIGTISTKLASVPGKWHAIARWKTAEAKRAAWTW